MLRLMSAVLLSLVAYVGLAGLMVPGLNSIEDGLDSGRRIALTQYAEDHAD